MPRRSGLNERRYKTAALVAATSLTALALAGCSSARAGGTAGSENATAADGLLKTSQCQQYQAAPGVTSSEIKLGATVPLTGPLAHPEIIAAEKAYYAYAAANLKGLGGRKITLDVKDDAYDPSKAQQNVLGLVQSDQVFALAGSFGTATTLGYWNTTNQQCVPNLFVQSGASELGDPTSHPWTLPIIPPYAGEGISFAKALAAHPGIKTVAVLAQNDDLGNAYIAGLRKGLAGSAVKIVGVQTFSITDPTVQTQVGILAHTKADALMIAGLGPQVPAAINGVSQLGWNPTMLVAGPAAQSGRISVAQPKANQDILTTGYLMDPSDPQWATEGAMKTYKQAMAKYAPQTDASQINAALGWTIGAAVYATLDHAKQLTRIDVMASARTLQDAPGLLLPGLRINMAPTHPFAVQGIQMEKYNASTTKDDLVKEDGTLLPKGQTSITDFTSNIAGALK